jgi:elongation factor P hydroxylase
MSHNYRVVEHTVNCCHSREYATATVNGDADKPRLAVKQYIPLDNPNPQPGDVTIIGAHANGFPKVSIFSLACIRLLCSESLFSVPVSYTFPGTV